MSKMLAVALVALFAASASAQVIDTSGVSIRVTKVSGPNDLDSSWIVDNTTCVGQVLYNITNVGDSTITPWIYGPLTVSAPAGSKAVLIEPGNYLYNTTAQDGQPLSSAFDIFNVGYYAAPNGWTVFALTVKCSGDFAEKTTCGCAPGSLPNSVTARTNTTGGRTNVNCKAPFVLAANGLCVKVDRAYPANGDYFDNWWNHSDWCFGQTLYNVTNGGEAPVENGFQGTMKVRLSNAYIYQANVYNYQSDDVEDAADNLATTFTIKQAGWYTAPGYTSQFAISTLCEGMCPCKGFKADFDISAFRP